MLYIFLVLVISIHILCLLFSLETNSKLLLKFSLKLYLNIIIQPTLSFSREDYLSLFETLLGYASFLQG